MDSEAGNTYTNFEVAELLKIWREKIIEIDPTEKERPSLGGLLKKVPEVISVPCSNKIMELKMGYGNDILVTSVGIVWKLLRPSCCPHPHASLIEEIARNHEPTALGFFSRMCSLQSLEMLESERQLVTALSVES